MSRLIENLTELMGAMSENQLSALTGVPQPTINRILRGESKNPTDKTVEPLARHFGVTVETLKRGILLGGTTPPRVSQAVRIDVPTLRSATRSLLDVCDMFNLEYDPVEDADLLAEFYARAVADGGQISGANVIVLANLMQRRGAPQQEVRRDDDGTGRFGKSAARKGRA